MSYLFTQTIGGQSIDFFSPHEITDTQISVNCCPAGTNNPQPQVFKKGDPQTGNTYLALLESWRDGMRITSLAQSGK